MSAARQPAPVPIRTPVTPCAPATRPRRWSPPPRGFYVVCLAVLGELRLVAGGLLAVTLAYALLLPAVHPSAAPRVGMGWLVACLTLLVVGELLVAPLGLSLLLQLVTPRRAGLVVGVWYGAAALGFAVAGELGALWSLGSAVAVVSLLVLLPLGGFGLLWLATRWPDERVKISCQTSAFFL